MISANLLGFIVWNINPMWSVSFFSSKHMLNASLIRKLFVSNRIGAANTRNWIHFSPRLASLTPFHAPTHTNRTARLNVSIVMSSMLASPFWPKLPCHSVFGMLPSKQHVFWSIDFLVKLFSLLLLSPSCLASLLIIRSSKRLDVHAGHVSVPTTITNYSSDLSSVFSWGTVACIKATSACIFPLDVSMFRETLSLTNNFFHSLKFSRPAMLLHSLTS